MGKAADSGPTLSVTLRGGRASAEWKQRLGAVGALESVPGHPRSFLLTLRDAKADLARALEEVRTLAGDTAVVQEIPAGEAGGESQPALPTDRLTVRFKGTPTEAELGEFAGRLNLVVDGRNSYIPSQVAFRLAEGAKESVHEVLERMSDAGGDIVKAWPETLAAYRRG